MSHKRTSSARGLRNPGYKGKFMPSFATQDQRSTKPVMTWRAGLQSTSQQKRNLRSRVRHLIDSDDPVIISVGDRVIRSVCHEPDPEFTSLHLFAAALDASEETKEPWVVCMNHIMDKFEGKIKMPNFEMTVIEDDEDANKNAAGDQKPSRLRGLLRSLIPRRLRASNEATTETQLHQSVGDGTGEHRDTGRSDTAQSD